jgi:hypothetical protein
MALLEVKYRDGAVFLNTDIPLADAQAFLTNLNSQRTAISIPNGAAITRANVMYARVE